MNVRLRFVNRAATPDPVTVVIFQREIGTGLDAMHVAWKVIERCPADSYHPFCFATELEACVLDAYGNRSRHVTVEPGQRLVAQQAHLAGGQRLLHDGRAASAGEIEICNRFPRGAIRLLLLRNGRPVISKGPLAPGEKALFVPAEEIFVACAAQIEEGAAIASAIVGSAVRPLSLSGIASADVVMSGGGSGPDSTPFEFQLENIVPM